MQVPCGPPRFDPEGPSNSRVWNYLLGGDNYGDADERAAEALLAICPQARRMAAVSRVFCTRAVSYAVSLGVTQIIDLGSGVPPRPLLHEAARSVVPGVTAAYVDLDELTLGELDAVAGPDPGVALVAADLRDPGAVLGDPGLGKVIDLAEPVCLVAASVLHAMDAAVAAEAVAGYAGRLAAGSYLAVAVPRYPDPAVLDAMNAVLAPASMRSFTDAEIAGLFAGLEVVPPGIRPAITLRPGWADACRVPPPGAYMIGGIGRKP